MNSLYFNPVRAHFGVGAVGQLPSLVGTGKIVLVTFREAAALGLLDGVIKACGDNLAGTIDGVEPNPDIVDLTVMYRNFWQRYTDCETIIAVGGGSVLDTAKVLMVGTHSGEFDELLSLLSAGSPFKPSRVKRLITVPTTAGTGSEVTPWATVWDHTINHRKYSLHLNETWPYAAIVDPALTYSLPAAVTLQSGLDALSHALEAIWNVNANPISDALAVSAAREVLEVLPALMRDLGSTALRARASLAALKAGMAFSNTKTALAHSISYEMTIQHGLPHGIACSFTLPMVMRLALERDNGRDAVLHQIFPGPLAAAPDYLTEFIEGLGVSTSFESYGIAPGQSKRMIADALSGPRGKNFIGIKTPAHL